VLVSLQAQVLTAEPYRNEPGLEHGSAAACEEYNRSVRFYTAMAALLDAVPPPPGRAPSAQRVATPELDELIRTHLRRKRTTIMATVRAWAARDVPVPARDHRHMPGLVQPWEEIYVFWTWPQLIDALDAALGAL
jgi:hypothetical protein